MPRFLQTWHCWNETLKVLVMKEQKICRNTYLTPCFDSQRINLVNCLAALGPSLVVNGSDPKCSLATSSSLHIISPSARRRLRYSGSNLGSALKRHTAKFALAQAFRTSCKVLILLTPFWLSTETHFLSL